MRPLVIAAAIGLLGAVFSSLEEAIPAVSAWVPRTLFPSHADPQVAQIILGGIAASIMTVVSIVFAILQMTLTLAIDAVLAAHSRELCQGSGHAVDPRHLSRHLRLLHDAIDLIRHGEHGCVVLGVQSNCEAQNEQQPVPDRSAVPIVSGRDFHGPLPSPQVLP